MCGQAGGGDFRFKRPLDVCESAFGPEKTSECRVSLESNERNFLSLRVTQRLEVITAECVFGMNLFKDFFASITDILGGRSSSFQKVLRDARRTCLTELRREALIAGANAIVGVDLDYSEISGDGKNMLFLVASGTAVIVEKV